MQRYDDARYLLDGFRTTGAVYLAGFSVECILKALVLSAAPQRRQYAIVKQFRGSKAHEFEWLKAKYYQGGGSLPPRDVTRAFAYVNRWHVSMRYNARTVRMREAQDFFAAAESILNWADGRM
jgi:hypothetical protein